MDLRRSFFRRLRVRSKVWLELDGVPVFGDGKADLLRRIEQYGTLRGAARMMSLSYRAAWGRLREMEKRMGVALVNRHPGGAHGGRAQLTDAGRELLRAYDRFRQGLETIIEKRFARRFARD